MLHVYCPFVYPEGAIFFILEVMLMSTTFMNSPSLLFTSEVGHRRPPG